MPAFLVLLKAAAFPMMKVLLTCALGGICATSRVGLLRPETRSALSRLNVAVLLPPFLFVTLMKGFTLSRLDVWWPIPLFVVLNNMLGLSLGYILLTLLGSRAQRFRGVLLAACTCGNVRD